MLTLMKWWSTLINHWIFGGTREDLAKILMSTRKNDPKRGYSPQNWRVSQKKTYQQAAELSGRIVSQKDWSRSWQIYMVLLLFATYLFVFIYFETHWNTPSSKMIGVPQEFSNTSSHFEIAILRLNLLSFRSFCIFRTAFQWSPMFHKVSCFVTFCHPNFHMSLYEFMVPSVPSVSAVICALFPPPVSGIRGTFGKRLSDDREAAAVPGFGQRSTEDFGSKPTFQRWTLHQFADPWGGEWRGFQDVPRNSENLELSSKSGFRNFVINSSGRCSVINIWRTTGSEKSPRTLVCVLCPMACDLTYTVSMFVRIACTNMLVRKKCRDFTVLRWFKMF